MNERSTTPGRGTPARTAPAPGEGRALATRALASSAALGTVAALVVTSATYVAARAAGLDLVVTPPGGSAGEVPYAAVLGAVVASGIVAFVAALVLRRLRHGGRWFTTAGTMALLGSFASPVGAAEELSTAAVLSLMHVVVGVCLIPLLARRIRANQ